MRFAFALLCAATLSACVASGDPSQPLPTQWIPAPVKSDQLMIVLPGRGDNLQALSRSGIAAAIQSVRPATDVVLVELTLPYYTARVAPQRLHDEVVEPARHKGYRSIWITGASMGGMGAILYDARYPDSIDGMILLAPYLGERDLITEIEQAGGLRGWQPGAFDPGTDAGWPRGLWQHLQTWASKPQRTERVWLAYGERDRLRYAMPGLESVLKDDHVLRVGGGHAWSVWTPAARRLLELDARAAATKP